MELHDFALELIGKAGADEYAVDRLIDDLQVDNAIK